MGPRKKRGKCRATKIPVEALVDVLEVHAQNSAGPLNFGRYLARSGAFATEVLEWGSTANLILEHAPSGVVAWSLGGWALG